MKNILIFLFTVTIASAATIGWNNGIFTASGINVTGLSPSSFVATDASKNLVSSDLPNTFLAFMEQTNVTSGSGQSYNIANNQLFNHYWFQSSSPANGDSFEVKFLLQAGTYTLKLHGTSDTIAGILDCYIDNVLIFSPDLYGSFAFNVTYSHNFTITTSGLHTFKGTINGKNASSTGFYYELTFIEIKP